MQKLMKDKAAKGGAVIAIWILVIAVVGGLGYMIFQPEKTAGTNTLIEASKSGELASLKLSAEAVSQDDPVQFAATGYCWDQADPTSLLESRNGKTLSATAGTTFAPVTTGNSYECTAFSSTHMCEHDSGKMSTESLQLRVDCKNVTSADGLKVTFYEDDQPESTNSISVGAGATETYNKFMIEVNKSEVVFPVKAICLGSNDTDSDVSDYRISGWTVENTIPKSLGSSADDACFSISEAVMLEDWASHVFMNNIIFESDGDDVIGETITVTVYDECEYVAKDGSVKTDFFKRETQDENDCGATNPTFSIALA